MNGSEKKIYLQNDYETKLSSFFFALKMRL